jgi:hypothetical protein
LRHLQKIYIESRFGWRARGTGVTLRRKLRGFQMASIEHFDVKPQIGTAGRVEEISRTHNMLVASAVASMIIVVVAALFMTMF